jgi:uncharacterized protein (TIGR02145 family)
MAENLHYKCVGSYDYDSYDLSNRFGYLYKYTAMEKACPEGWHIPSEKEWQTLFDFLGGNYAAGSHLKETGSENWTDANLKVSDNSSGFSARGSGVYSSAKVFLGLKDYSYFWTSETTRVGFYSASPAVIIDKRIHKNDKHSGPGMQYYYYIPIRCIKD